MPKLNEINIPASIPIIIILLFLVYKQLSQDYKNTYYVKSTICHKELPIKRVSIEDRLKVESILDRYMERRERNTSKISSVLYEIRNGAVRGIVSATLLGGGLNEITAGALVYGTISGFSKAYTQQSVSNTYLDPLKT